MLLHCNKRPIFSERVFLSHIFAVDLNLHSHIESGSKQLSEKHSKNKAGPKSGADDYKMTLRLLQIELVKLQREIIKTDSKIVVIFEGRDAAGKDGTIKRITKHLSPRETRVVALGKPSDHDLKTWYFQRFICHLPESQEMTLFNRSWYNRAGVEHVMGFCSKEKYQEFLVAAPKFEQMLVSSGMILLKYYLDISRKEQVKRLKERRNSPLTQWKISPIDEVAVEHWDDYSHARDVMLARTHHAAGPWTVIRADHKHVARINVMKDMLFHLDYKGKDKDLVIPDPNIAFKFEESCLKNGLIAN